jgi:plasmid stabilization system protein ParE
MARTAVRLAESAVEDLEAIRRWYAGEGVPEVGTRFVKAILERVEALQRHPEMGRVVPEFDQPALRELIHPPFRIVYRCSSRRVEIARVWRSERLLVLPPS